MWPTRSIGGELNVYHITWQEVNTEEDRHSRPNTPNTENASRIISSLTSSPMPPTNTVFFALLPSSMLCRAASVRRAGSVPISEKKLRSTSGPRS